jgi:RNA polymerase sigma-70 factor (ECF subfamily)
MALFSEEVAQGVRAGSPDAVGSVYVVLADRLLGYLVARVRDRSTAEDLLAATFEELLQKGYTIKGGPQAIKVWLFQAAHFNALDHIRKVSRRSEDLEDELTRLDTVEPRRGPEELAVSAETGSRIRSALERLSEDQRQIVLLRYVGGLTSSEVASVTGKSDGAVRSLQHRGERALARVLEVSQPSAPDPGARASEAGNLA